jgi:hypothetical protein
VYPVPDPLLLRKSGSAGNGTRDLQDCSQELQPLDHRSNHTALQVTDIKFQSLSSECMELFLCFRHSTDTEVPGSIPVLPYFLSSNESGKGSTHPRGDK